MSMDTPLPPDLEKIVREQLATGRFRSPDEVFRAAIQLLEEQQVLSDSATKAWLKQEIDKGVNSKPAAPVTDAFWERLRDRVRYAAGAGHDD
jgi:putative addiction module CopG family antidote